MQFFYTGADFFQGSQTNIEKSLGGFMSSSVVPNNSLNNIFSDVSSSAQYNGRVETKGVVLKNTTNATVTDVKLYQTYPTGVIVKLEWAFVSLVGGQQMERIPSSIASPYTGTFVEPNGISGEITIVSSLPAGSAIGVWIRRTVLTPPPQNAIPAAQLEAYLNALSKQETTDVNLSWT